jgi:serine/threonine protein kinase
MQQPENFLFKRPDDDVEIKIIDFGLSRFEEANAAMTTRVGTPYYIGKQQQQQCLYYALKVFNLTGESPAAQLKPQRQRSRAVYTTVYDLIMCDLLLTKSDVAMHSVYMQCMCMHTV